MDRDSVGQQSSAVAISRPGQLHAIAFTGALRLCTIATCWSCQVASDLALCMQISPLSDAPW